jgi:ribonucleoside-diphosphate reductase alpha chain
VEVFPTRCKPEELTRILELATFYASTVALLRSHSEETNEVVARNRRIGVSVSGIADWLDATSVSNVFDTLNKGYDVVRETNRRLAKEAGVAESIRVTTVKPSGTVSLLAGVSSGMHHPLAGYVLRRVRVARNSPVAQILESAGVPFEQDVVSENTDVFEFPLRYGQGRTRSVKSVSVFEQAGIVAMLQRCWADNAVSNTLTVQPEEMKHVESVLSLFAPLVKSMSLLPDRTGVYEQMPVEHMSKAEYEKRQAELAEVDWDDLKGSDGDASDSAYCSNDICEVPSV